jgi:hypothetical protein
LACLRVTTILRPQSANPRHGLPLWRVSMTKREIMIEKVIQARYKAFTLSSALLALLMTLLATTV